MSWQAEERTLEEASKGDMGRFQRCARLQATCGFCRIAMCSAERRGAHGSSPAHPFRAFGAPVLMLVHTPRYMGPPQWSDIGMWLQTVMLLLREEGLDSCPQESWAMYTQQIRECVSIPDDHIFFCGMAIGHRDPDAPVNRTRMPREHVRDFARLDGFEPVPSFSSPH